MKEQQELNIEEAKKAASVADYKFEPIRGQPMLRWAGKRPFTSTQYFPAQEKERHGDEVNGWMNEIYWGDNIQVMSHLLKKYRGRVNLIYIDPPFDSKADYKKTITLRGQKVENDHSSFEDKQYTDIWTNDEYLQFMYERLILCRELLADTGSIYLHCDWHKNHYLRCLLDEVFGADHFVNEIIWRKSNSHNDGDRFGSITESIYWYGKSMSHQYNKQFYEMDEKSYTMVEEETGRRFKSVSMNAAGAGEARYFGDKLLIPPTGTHWRWSQERINQALGTVPPKIFFTANGVPRYKQYMDEMQGNPVQNLWADDMEELPIENLWMDFMSIASQATERLDYPTQKPEALLARIIKASSNPGDLVFDCFMGSGTTQAVAMKLGRKFIGADINLGAVQTTTKRLLGIAKEIGAELTNTEEPKYTGFTIYNVNNYDVFRNPVEARDLLVQALELQPLPGNSLYDGEKDEWFYKIMPVNRLATKADLNEIVANFDNKAAERKALENPGKPVLKVRLVCMGHEPDLKAELEKQLQPFKVEIEVVDILRDKKDLVFKRDSEAEIVRKDGKVKIEAFYPFNLMKKLSLQKSKVGEWRELVESVMIDFNYDGAVFTPSIVDVPEDNAFVKGEDAIPDDAGTIRVKITDLLAESFEMEVK